MTVELPWPDDVYSLPQTGSGQCPDDFVAGWVYQDNEDTNNENSWDPSNLSAYLKADLGSNYNISYCTKEHASGNEIPHRSYLLLYVHVEAAGYYNNNYYPWFVLVHFHACLSAKCPIIGDTDSSNVHAVV